MDDKFLPSEATRKRRRWGCACGCAVFMVAALFGTIGFFVYLLKPVDQLPRERFLGPESAGYGVVRINLADEGLGAVVTRNLRAMSEWQARQAGGNQGQSATLSYDVLRQFLTQFVHPDVHFLRATPLHAGRKPATVGVVQLRNTMAHLLVRMVLRSAASQPDTGPGSLEIVESDGIELFAVRGSGQKSGGGVALVGSAVVAGGDAEAVRLVAQRVASGKTSATTQMLADYMTDLDTSPAPPGEDLTFVITNEGDALAAMLDNLGRRIGAETMGEAFLGGLTRAGLSGSDIKGARLGADLQSADRAKVELAVDCASADAARKMTVVLREAGEQMLAGAGADGLAGKVEVRQATTRAIATIDVTGLEPVMGDLFGLKDGAAGTARPTN